jgi:acyl carrier protein
MIMTHEEILQKMQELVGEQFAMEPAEVTMETSFEEDLGADSVDLVELVMAMEEEFEVGEIQEDDLTGLKTVGDAVNYLVAKLK